MSMLLKLLAAVTPRSGPWTSNVVKINQVLAQEFLFINPRFFLPMDQTQGTRYRCGEEIIMASKGVH